MAPNSVQASIEYSLMERSRQEGTGKHKQVSLRLHPSMFALLERVALQLGKSPTGTGQMLLVSALFDAAGALGIDLDVELDPEQLIFEYPWLFVVKDIQVIEQERDDDDRQLVAEVLNQLPKVVEQ
jgi:hypothetical protein